MSAFFSSILFSITRGPFKKRRLNEFLKKNIVTDKSDTNGNTGCGVFKRVYKIRTAIDTYT